MCFASQAGSCFKRCSMGAQSGSDCRACEKKAQAKIPQIAASIAGHRLTDHQRFLIRHALRHLQFLDGVVEALNQEIRSPMEDPALGEAFFLLQSIPGIKEESAASILAEVGADIQQFPTAAQLNSWAGLCPANHGKRRCGEERPHQLRKHLVEDDTYAKCLGCNGTEKVHACNRVITPSKLAAVTSVPSSHSGTRF